MAIKTERIAARQGDFAEADYREHTQLNGSLVHVMNIAKVRSARFRQRRHHPWPVRKFLKQR